MIRSHAGVIADGNGDHIIDAQDVSGFYDIALGVVRLSLSLPCTYTFVFYFLTSDIVAAAFAEMPPRVHPCRRRSVFEWAKLELRWTVP